MPEVSLRILWKVEPTTYQSLLRIYHNLGPADRSCSPANLFHKTGPCSSKSDERWQEVLTVREKGENVRVSFVVEHVVDTTLSAIDCDEKLKPWSSPETTWLAICSGGRSRSYLAIGSQGLCGRSRLEGIEAACQIQDGFWCRS